MVGNCTNATTHNKHSVDKVDYEAVLLVLWTVHRKDLVWSGLVVLLIYLWFFLYWACHRPGRWRKSY